MSQSTPFGTPLEPELTPELPPASGEGGGRKRSILIAGATAVALVAAGGAAFALTSGGGDDVAQFTLPSTKPMTTAASTTASPSLSVLATEAAVNARNPFVRPPSRTASVTGAAGVGGAAGAVQKVTTVTAVATVVKAGPTATSTVKTTRIVRTTAPATAVSLALFSLDQASKVAVFGVSSPTEAAGAKYTQTVGKTFGKDSAFKYKATTVDADGVICALVTYVDEESQICPGELVKVHGG